MALLGRCRRLPSRDSAREGPSTARATGDADTARVYDAIGEAGDEVPE